MIRRLAPLLACALLFAQSLLEQADAAFRTGDLDRAVALAKKVLAADPSAIHAHLIAGVVAAQRNQWPECSRHFQAVKRLAPANPYSYFYLGQAALYQHQWEAAVREFTAAAARNYPDLDRLRVELALALVESGKPREAMASLEKVTPPSSGWPFAGQYYAVTGFAQGKLGQADGAIQAIRRAREIDALNPQYAEFLISTLLATNQNSVALAEAIQAQRRFPDHLEVQFLFGLASYYVTQGSFTRLALRNSREAGPDSPQTLLLAGLVSRQEGKQEEAAESFRKAAKAGLPDAHLLLGLVSRDTGDLEAAEREFREAERLNPNNGQVRLELGKILLGRGDTAGARARLEKAVELMPGASPAHYQLAVLYGRLGLQEKAAEHLATYRQLQKQEAESAGAARPQQ
ncbi:MAG: tetratricopeptide repeat protein [Acidobacteria bacterium]|nr:tetratricopeptide repeat protein [Acidobacteriota bacterium]